MLPPMPSQIGRQNLPVDREKARMLVGEIGYTEAAKRTGIARNTLYQWKHRYKWSILRAGETANRRTYGPAHFSEGFLVPCPVASNHGVAT
jgi:transposase-like protein